MTYDEAIQEYINETILCTTACVDLCTFAKASPANQQIIIKDWLQAKLPGLDESLTNLKLAVDNTKVKIKEIKDLLITL